MGLGRGFLGRLGLAGRNLARAGDALATDIAESGAPGLLGKVLGAVVGVGVDIGKAGLKAASNPKNTKRIKNAMKKGYEVGKNASLSTGANLIEYADDTIKAGSVLRSQLLGHAPMSTAKYGEDHIITRGAKLFKAFREDDNSVLLGLKMTNRAYWGLAVPGMLVSGVPEAGKDLIDNRRGRHDGQLYTNAPINEYATMGDSYNRNAGATGDLVFALHNQRHTGLF